MKCSLCAEDRFQLILKKKKCGREYYKCETCEFIFLSPEFYLSTLEECAHYNKHNNQVEDPAYQAFVMPLVEMILKHTRHEMQGLDYGCGPGPVVAHLLEKKSYSISYYDLFFKDDKTVLDKKYDFIILSEVAEHFQQPIPAFTSLAAMLKPDGKIFIMTALVDRVKDFTSWHYHRDPTHVSFFSINTLALLAEQMGLKLVESDGLKVTALVKVP